MVPFLCQIVPFVHPTIAGIALATGLIPILVHLINRRRYRRVPWAAMSFLLTANRRSAKRVWLEQWALLLTRMALIVLFGLALARPFIARSSLIPFVSSRSHRVLLIDNSLSMNARALEGRTRFELARRCAERLIESFPRTDAVSIVTLAAPAKRIVGHASYDRRFVKERLAGVKPTQRAGDWTGAIDAALDILDASDLPVESRVVYVLSDFTRREWSSVGEPGSADPAAATISLQRLADALSDPAKDLHVIRVDADATRNVAVTRLEPDSTLLAVRLPTRIAAEVTNFGPLSEYGLALQILQDGKIVRRLSLPALEPGGSTQASVTLGFASPGTHVVEARIVETERDVLDEDNAAYLSLDIREAMPVLLVDGRPGDTALTGQAGFLATALAPKVSVDDQHSMTRDGNPFSHPVLIEPKVITGPELDGEALNDYDVVALCNVQRLSREQWQRLEQFVSRGGGLFVFAGDLINVDNYNRFGYADGRGVLPGGFGRPVDLVHADDPGVGLDVEDLTHEIAADFRAQPNSGLFLARVYCYLPFEPDARRAEVAVRYTDGAAALVASGLGRGRILVLTTTANMDWTNLPAKGDYVSLMLSAFAHLSPRHGEHRNIMVGEFARERLRPAETSLPLRIAAGNDVVAEGRLVPIDDALALEYGPIESAGVLIASIGSRVVKFTANVDPAESDLISIEKRAFVEALDRPVRVVSDATALADGPVTGRFGELALILFYLVIVLLVVEMGMALRFGSLRTVS